MVVKSIRFENGCAIMFAVYVRLLYFFHIFKGGFETIVRFKGN